MSYYQHETLVAAEGHDIHTQLWVPEGQPSCVIQILHGLGEHSDRYARVAAKAVERVYSTYVNCRGRPVSVIRDCAANIWYV